MIPIPPLLIKLVVGGATLITTLRYGTGLYFWRVTENLERPEYTVITKLSNGVELRRYEPYLIAETIVDGTGFKRPTADGFRTCAGYIFGKNRIVVSPSTTKSAAANGSSEKMEMTAPVRIQGQNNNNNNNNGGDISEKMDMTAPVRVQGQGATGGSGGYYDNNSKKNQQQQKTKVSFVIGKKYSKKTAPVPLDANITIREVPAHTLAVRTFNGPPPDDDRVEAERRIIMDELSKNDIMRAAQQKGRTWWGKLMSPQSANVDDTFVYGYHDPFITPNALRRNEVGVLVEGNA